MNDTRNVIANVADKTPSRKRLTRKILVVEDEAVLRQITVMTLMQAGYDVEGAEDGEAGWEAIHDGHYDLLITDNNMPRLTGLQLVKNLRLARFTLPVILASGSFPVNPPDLNLSALLPKPFSSQQLVDTVRKVFWEATRNAGTVHADWESEPEIITSGACLSNKKTKRT